MKKYKWSLTKSMQFLKSKKQDVDIPPFFYNQLVLFETRLLQRGELKNDIPWTVVDLNDPEEKLLRNTYVNGLPPDKNNIINTLQINNLHNLGIGQKQRNKNITWADMNILSKNNFKNMGWENDLFLQKDPPPVTVHLSKKPLRSCIKGVKTDIKGYMSSTMTNLKRGDMNMNLNNQNNNNPENNLINSNSETTLGKNLNFGKNSQTYIPMPNMINNYNNNKNKNDNFNINLDNNKNIINNNTNSINNVINSNIKNNNIQSINNLKANNTQVKNNIQNIQQNIIQNNNPNLKYLTNNYINEPNKNNNLLNQQKI